MQPGCEQPGGFDPPPLLGGPAGGGRGGGLASLPTLRLEPKPIPAAATAWKGLKERMQSRCTMSSLPLPKNFFNAYILYMEIIIELLIRIGLGMFT
jgi:hypothetical protein